MLVCPCKTIYSNFPLKQPTKLHSAVQIRSAVSVLQSGDFCEAPATFPGDIDMFHFAVWAKVL